MATRSIRNLDEHPDQAEIVGVLSQVPHVSDDELRRLARAWRNTVAVAEARRRALLPDSPLVVDVLAAFDTIGALYEDEVCGDAEPGSVEPAIVVTALRAMRDAVAGAYARPTLARGEHHCLTRAWRSVFPRARLTEPDLGPGSPQVRELLRALPRLADRCHDTAALRLYDGLAVEGMTRCDDDADEARREALAAAARSNRRRVWTLMQRSVAERIGRGCPDCRRSAARGEPSIDDERVLSVCSDAASALLVGDVLPPQLLACLTHPVRHLVGLQQPIE